MSLEKITAHLDLVPIIPGVRWETCLQIQVIRINLGMCGTPPDYEDLAKNERDFPEAVAALRAGRAPDYKLIEDVISKRIIGWNRGIAKAPRAARGSEETHKALKDMFHETES